MIVEVQIENSVSRVTIRHHKACRVMPNSYPEWRNVLFRTEQPLWIVFLEYSSFDNYI